MKNLSAIALGVTALLSGGVVSAQSGNMMDGAGPGSGWMGGYVGMGGYGGILLPVLLVAVAVGLVWVVSRRRNKEGS